MAGYIRVGPGQYRGPDGRIINSATDPNKGRPNAANPRNRMPTGTTDATFNQAGQDLGQDAFSKAMALIDSGQLGQAVDVKPEETQGVYDAAYAKMTRDLGRNKELDQKKMEDTLYQRGISYSADPASQYQQQLHDLNTNYNTQQENAAQSATLLQGQEADRIYNQRLGNQQNLNQSIQTLGGLGVNWGQLSNQQKQILMQKVLQQMQGKTAVQIAGINNRRSGGGGGSEDSAFIGL